MVCRLWPFPACAALSCLLIGLAGCKPGNPYEDALAPFDERKELTLQFLQAAQQVPESVWGLSNVPPALTEKVLAVVHAASTNAPAPLEAMGAVTPEGLLVVWVQESSTVSAIEVRDERKNFTFKLTLPQTALRRHAPQAGGFICYWWVFEGRRSPLLNTYLTNTATAGQLSVRLISGYKPLGEFTPLIR